jgi:hypothetical protein
LSKVAEFEINGGVKKYLQQLIKTTEKETLCSSVPSL